MVKSRVPESGHSESLAVAAIGAPVEIRRHPAARRMTLRVSRTRRAVYVTLPLQCDLAAAHELLSSNIEWVRERLGTVPEPVPFVNGAVFPLRGVWHTIAFAGPLRQRPIVNVLSQNCGTPQVVVAGRLPHAPRRLKDWLAAAALQDLDERVRLHARTMRVAPRRIGVRDQISRWGSCSSTGCLSFSWRLILAPSVVLDYVAAHEVAHLAEMNHGPRFWKLVTTAMPHTEEARTWLRCYGNDLHRYGAITPPVCLRGPNAVVPKS